MSDNEINEFFEINFKSITSGLYCDERDIKYTIKDGLVYMQVYYDWVELDFNHGLVYVTNPVNGDKTIILSVNEFDSDMIYDVMQTIYLYVAYKHQVDCNF